MLKEEEAKICKAREYGCRKKHLMRSAGGSGNVCSSIR